MKNLFAPTNAAEIKDRLARLRPDSPRQWGTMTPSQAVAHLAEGMRMAIGDVRPPRMLVGRLAGGIIKRIALGDDKPFRRNTPTAKELLVPDERNFDVERIRLSGLIDQFVSAGPAGCTTHPHAFFGRLTPNEWAILTYKHLDHHLRQFGV